MRRSEVVANTARQFKEAGYKVNLCVSCAPPEFTAHSISLPDMLVSLQTHGEVVGLLTFVVTTKLVMVCLAPNLRRSAYHNDDVDRMRLYSMFGTEVLAVQRGDNGQWTIQKMPSEVVEGERQAIQ